jgi:hypothetical protein
MYMCPGGNVVHPREVADRLETRYTTSLEKERSVKNLMQTLQSTFKTIYTSKLKDNSASGDAGHGSFTPEEARSHALASGKLPSELVTALISLHQVQQRIKHHQTSFSTEVGGVLAGGIDLGPHPCSYISLQSCPQCMCR